MQGSTSVSASEWVVSALEKARDMVVSQQWFWSSLSSLKRKTMKKRNWWINLPV